MARDAMMFDNSFHTGIDLTNGSGSFTGTGTNVPTGQSLGISGGDWLGAGVALVNAGINAYSQYKTNETNQEISQRNYDAVMQTNAMNKELSERTWARDDSQLQRARRDAELAGFSPMAALSNNLTNSSPLQMQAPQYTHTNIAPQVDLSNVGNIFSQAALKKQQTEQLAIANQYSKETLNLQKLKTATELQKLLNDLDSQKLSNAEKASVLLASGFKKSDVENLLKNNRLYDVPSNTSQQHINDLQDAQRKLANAQTTTQGKLQSLYAQQEALALIQTEDMQANYNYWYKPLDNDSASIYIPTKDEKGIWHSTRVTSTGKTRKDLLDNYNQHLNDFVNSVATYNYNWSTSDYKLLNDLALENAHLLIDMIKTIK